MSASERAKEEELRWYGHVLGMEEDNPMKLAWRKEDGEEDRHLGGGTELRDNLGSWV